MKGPQPISEGAARVRERDAFVAGIVYCTAHWNMLNYDPRREMDRLFPLPKIEHQRIVRDPHSHEPQWGKPREWMCHDGQLYSRTIGLQKNGEPFPWVIGAQIPPTPLRVKLWSDLLTRPVELVEDDGSGSSGAGAAGGTSR